MQTNFFNKNNQSFWLGLSLFFLTSFFLGYYFYLYQLKIEDIINKQGDAYAYYLFSKDLIVLTQNSIRTYGYPIFLWLVHHIFSLNGVINFPIFLIHFFIYSVSALFFSFAVTKVKEYRFLILSSLLLNVYLLPYLSIYLTETLSISLLLVVCGLFWRLKESNLRSFLIGAIVGFAIEVRPANLWVLAFMFILIALDCRETKSIKSTLLSLFFYCLGALILFAPQLYINYFYFHKITFLPAFDLGGFHYSLGKQWPHTSFDLANQQSVAIRNPFALVTNHKFHCLTINGASFLLFKLILLFSHCTFFVYQYLTEAQQKIVIFFVSFNLYFGFMGMVMQSKRIPYEKMRAILIGLFLCVFLHIFTTLEDRFTIAIYMVLFPFALFQSWQCLIKKQYRLLAVFPFIFLLMNLFNTLTHILSPGYANLIALGLR